MELHNFFLKIDAPFSFDLFGFLLFFSLIFLLPHIYDDSCINVIKRQK